MVSKEQEYVFAIKRTLLQMSICGGIICLIAYGTGQSWRIPGLVLGNITSVVYFLLMSYRIRKSADLPVGKAVTYMRVGWIIRLSFIVMMLIISLRLPQFDFLSAVAGLFILQVVMIASAVVAVLKEFKIKHR